MWAYGTVLLTILEFDRGASWTILTLPIVCSISSVSLAFICWRRGVLKWPEDDGDKIAFIADVLLSIGYALTWILLWKGTLTTGQRELAALVVLILTNGTILTSFAPMARGIIEDPNRERILPWMIWSLAYTSLAVLTFIESGWSEFMIYPLINLVIHFTISQLVLFRRRSRKRAAI